ncbi:hypothetical protein PTSG_00761 [Salpingoeca rosetta]|uniref:USP domain-containing protein n=1 Tax=Salpingoeca rosetta (strain ATCC 50818 / BSB-021) TaxID=946362 RepID=F2TXE2_SALR5|nr:uncharacterized protein PTSG_00761 [Salpingoeca rosetta]EGD76051.1 hypothetical protein PTSG_00761 [Salpingoeca rosetta]|eukprot:XP_004998226.1 hypothetical protein PTSG_00761 [Salpingoeca rosetta]
MDIWQLFEEDEAEQQYVSTHASPTKDSVPRPPDRRAQCNLAGLANLGTTCYLNSLIQTMYFTPQLRQRFYELTEADLGESTDRNDQRTRKIPLALRRLFARLQLLERKSVPVGELTAAFGWQRSQEIQQHDVQELNRVLFDAIEQSLVMSPGERIIRDMYEGKLVNIVQCLECGAASRREESFLDISVPVKDLVSLQQGLSKFTEMEHLCGDNKFRCSACDRLVEAYKGILLSSLPPIISFNLMRFSYDWNKGTRTKETNEYAFPDILDMKPYCTEDTELPEYEYALYSVVLHRGAAHSGHYYAYIRDVYNEGNWSKPASPSSSSAAGEKKKAVDVDFLMCNDAATCVHALLRSMEPSQLPVPIQDMTKALCDKTGQSWHKRFKRTNGPVRKFLKHHAALFEYDQQRDTVTLTDLGFSTDVCDVSIPDIAADQAAADSACWFEANDEIISAIPHAAIKKAFAGRDSAYMLFYARRDLIAAAAETSPPTPPQSLRALIDAENEELAQQREKYEFASNQRTLSLCSLDALDYSNHIFTFKQNQDEACVTITFDRRQPLSALIAAAREALPAARGTTFTTLQPLDDGSFYLTNDVFVTDEASSLVDASFPSGPVLFWDGTVDGKKIKYGETVVPVRLKITHFGRNRSEDSKFTMTFLRSTSLRAVRRALADHLALPQEYLMIHRLDASSADDEDKPDFLAEDRDNNTLFELSIRYSAELSVELGGRGDAPMAEQTFAHKQAVVPLLLKPSPQSRDGVTVDFERTATLRAVHKKLVALFGGSVKETRMRWSSIDDMLSKCPRLIVSENQPLKSAGLKPDDAVIIEDGSLAFADSQFVLRLKLGPKALSKAASHFKKEAKSSDVPLQHRVWEMFVSKSESVEMLHNMALSVMSLEGKDWHLCQANWCGEIGEPLNDLKARLDKTTLTHNSTLFLEHGAINGKGMITVEVWLNLDGIAVDDHLNNILSSSTQQQQANETHKQGAEDQQQTAGVGNDKATEAQAGDDAGADTTPSDEAQEPDESEEEKRIWCDPNLRRVSTVRVEATATLQQLKDEMMKLAAVQHVIPAPDYMRLREKVGYRQGRVLRNNASTLKKHKLFNNAAVCITHLPQGETLTDSDILFKVCLRDPTTRKTNPPQELAFNAQPPTFAAFKAWLSSETGVPVESLVAAKHLVSKGEWTVLRQQQQQQQQSNKNKSKKKKKNKPPKDNIRHAPLRLRDGDVIAVKDSALDPDNTDNFATPYDARVQAAFEASIASKRSERQQRQANNPEWYGSKGGDRKEVGISIQVPDFASLSVGDAKSADKEGTGGGGGSSNGDDDDADADKAEEQ